MATLTVISTADSGAGSLRQALEDAASGDTIVFDATTFPANTETAIYLSSQLYFPTKELTIDGGETWTVPSVWRDVDGVRTRVYIDANNPAQAGEVVEQRLKTRVVLDGQDSTRVMYHEKTSYLATLNALTFRNGTTPTSSNNGSFLGSRYGAMLEYNNCVFENGNSKAQGGSFSLADSASVVLNGCIVESCSAASNGGGAVVYGSSSFTANNCRFENCRAPSLGGAFYFYATAVGSFVNCVFANCYVRDGSVAALGGTADASFNRCLFKDNESTIFGCIARATNSSSANATIKNCVAYGNTAGTNNGTVVNFNLSSATAIIKGCTFGQNSAGKKEILPDNDARMTIVDSLIEQNVDFSTVGFVDLANNDFRLAPESSYLTGATGYQSGDVDYLGHARKANGAIGAYEGSWFVVEANGSATVGANSTVDYAEVGNGATITFNGTDRVLTVTTSATIGSATFQNGTDSTGYFATPTGTDLTSVTFTGVKTSTYGAGVSYVHAQIDGVEYVASSPSTPVLIEKQTRSTWTTLTDSAINGAYSTTLAEGDVIRVFDGVHFLSDAVPVLVDYWRVFSYAANTNGGGTDSDGNRIEAWTIDSYALAQNGGGYDPESGESLPGWTVSNYALTPNLKEAENENQ